MKMRIWKELIYWECKERDEYKIHTDFEVTESDIKGLGEIKGLENLMKMLELMPSNNNNGNDYRIHLEASVYLPRQYRKNSKKD